MRNQLFNDINIRFWNDWKWQIRNQIVTIHDLKKYLTLTGAEEESIQKCLSGLRMAITPYYLSLINPDDPADIIRKQSVPTEMELFKAEEDLYDPLHEQAYSPVPGLIHRYPDRVLLIVTNQCAMYCRHCTRRRFVGQRDREMPAPQIDKAIEYIRENAVIRDVVISGGDPLLLPDKRLESLLIKLREISHIEIIRIGTRTPVVLPQRITKKLVGMLKKYHPIWVNTHFNHPREITPEAKKACEMLVDAGIPVGNQTVLMAGINDCVQTMRSLMHELVKVRVRPYYIYQCDLSIGISHFRTSIAKGLEIIEGLQGHTSGLCVPTYVIDAPGGGGKVPITPNYLVSVDGHRTYLKNFEGSLFYYDEPQNYKQIVKESQSEYAAQKGEDGCCEGWHNL